MSEMTKCQQNAYTKWIQRNSIEFFGVENKQNGKLPCIANITLVFIGVRISTILVSKKNTLLQWIESKSNQISNEIAYNENDTSLRRQCCLIYTVIAIRIKRVANKCEDSKQ